MSFKKHKKRIKRIIKKEEAKIILIITLVIAFINITSSLIKDSDLLILNFLVFAFGLWYLIISTGGSRRIKNKKKCKHINLKPVHDEEDFFYCSDCKREFFLP